jgi:hypothetical protein
MERCRRIVAPGFQTTNTALRTTNEVGTQKALKSAIMECAAEECGLLPYFSNCVIDFYSYYRTPPCLQKILEQWIDGGTQSKKLIDRENVGFCLLFFETFTE